MKIMKGIILLVAIIIILALAVQAQGQSKADMAGIIDAVVVNAKSTALNSRLVNWDSVQTEMHQSAKRAKSVHDLRGSLELLLVSLKDKQGTFYDPTTSKRIAEYPRHEESKVANKKEFNAALESKFDYKILENNIGYIRLVATPADNDIQKQAALIRQAIDSLDKEQARYWIVDLRYAVGGNMNSFFAGVAPLLGEGLTATAVNGKQHIKNLYTVHNGNFYDNQVPVVRFPITNKAISIVKVAVLTSSHTTGAAEILALAFKGRKNSRLFGESTAGQVAGVSAVKISNNLVMSIAETIYVDRKGTPYSDSVYPDTVIEFNPNVDMKQDKAIAEASLWLATTPVTESTAKVTMN